MDVAVLSFYLLEFPTCLSLCTRKEALEVHQKSVVNRNLNNKMARNFNKGPPQK